MSKYFDALNRLRAGRAATPRPDLHLAEPTADLEEPTPGAGLPFPELQLASRQDSYAAVLDLLHAAIKTAPIPAVVIAGISGVEPVREVVAGIELQAHQKGILLKRGHLGLAGGSRVLQVSSRQPLRDSSPAEVGESLRLSSSVRPEALGRWLAQAASDSDLVLIEAPPILTSVEAAFLGQACGGLVVVAEVLTTNRSALKQAVERATLANCQIVGMVLSGTRRWLPGWIERILQLVRRS